MSLLVDENLPKEVKKEEFKSFLEKIKDDFPKEEFPEIFIHYQQVNDKVLVLGLGESAECGEQAYRAYQENPSLRKRKSDTRILRAPKKRFLLR